MLKQIHEHCTNLYYCRNIFWGLNEGQVSHPVPHLVKGTVFESCNQRSTGWCLCCGKLSILAGDPRGSIALAWTFPRAGDVNLSGTDSIHRTSPAPTGQGVEINEMFETTNILHESFKTCHLSFRDRSSAQSSLKTGKRGGGAVPELHKCEQ